MPLDTTRTRARRVRDVIVNGAADGKLAPGAKLPTERELARRCALRRNAVRRTLAQLEAEGAITRHVGRGTFLAGPAPHEPGQIATDSVSHTSPAELMEARLAVEPALAELI